MSQYSEKVKEFLNKLKDLIFEFDVTFTYSYNDDGIWVEVENDNINIGFNNQGEKIKSLLEDDNPIARLPS